MIVLELPKTKSEEKNLIDLLTQSNYDYNRKVIGMPAEDLALIYGKEKGAILEKNYKKNEVA